LNDGTSVFKIIELAMREPLIPYALRDLNECFIPNRTTVNCARVIETIRYMIHPTTKDDKRDRAWKAMQRALNIEHSFIKLISDHALSHRHGSYAPVDASTNDEISHRTWEIMNRFLEYRKRDNHPLTAPDFPLLS